MKILLSFIGTNDAGALLDKKDGAILTALSNEKFDEVILLWNEAKIKDEFEYSDVLLYLKREIKKRKLAKKMADNELSLKDVTDHNEIYLQLKDFTINLNKNVNNEYTAAISSGTPSMQVCWILLAESGDFSMDFPLRIMKVTDPKFGKSRNIDVKLNTSLPRIIGLQKEIDDLKNDLIPEAVLDIKHGSLKIGEVTIALSPVEFCYYRYFAQRNINDEELEKFSGYNVSKRFIKLIYSYHEESFPDLDANRFDMEEMLRKGYELPITTFRGHISKINKKLKNALRNESLTKVFQIQNEGTRGAKFYGLKTLLHKINIK
jgi:hypothetical protein